MEDASEDNVDKIFVSEQLQQNQQMTPRSKRCLEITSIRIPTCPNLYLVESEAEYDEGMPEGEHLSPKARTPTRSIPSKGRHILVKTEYSRPANPKPTPLEQRLLQARFPRRNAWGYQKDSSLNITTNSKIPRDSIPKDVSEWSQSKN
ncbi:uncharacterized protein LOC144783454 [Lissotriton helveticus]